MVLENIQYLKLYVLTSQPKKSFWPFNAFAKISGYHRCPTSWWLVTRAMKVPWPMLPRNISLKVASASDLTLSFFTKSRIWSGIFKEILSTERSRLTPWNTGKENLGPKQPSWKFSGRKLTRWVVAVQIPPVSASKDRPMLITNVPGSGGAGIHVPVLFWTSRPWWGVPCKRNVRNPESLWGPTPWNPESSLVASSGGGYLINFSLCCCGLSKTWSNVVGGRSNDSAINPGNNSARLLTSDRYASNDWRNPGIAVSSGHWQEISS